MQTHEGERHHARKYPCFDEPESPFGTVAIAAAGSGAGCGSTKRRAVLLLAGIEALAVMMEPDAAARHCQSKSAWASGDVPFSVEKGEAGIAGFRGYAAFVMVSMALLA